MNPAELRDAARDWLAASGDASPAEPVDVRAVSAVVSTGAVAEVVAVELGAGVLRTSCTCGQPRCAAQTALVRQLGADPGAGGEATRPVERRLVSSSGTVAAVDARGLEQADELSARLGPALGELLLATVRSGLKGSAAPREEAQRAVLALVEGHNMTGLRRVLARLEAAVRVGDAQRAGLALATVADLVDDLGERKVGATPAPRLAAALGEPGELEVMSDRIWVELGRERLALAGAPRMERRYLLDLKAGRLFAETVILGRSPASAGPSPRTLVVGLGEVARSGGVPLAAWPRQYAVGAEIATDAWVEIEAAAEREVDAVVRRYRQELEGLGAMAEPVCLFAPAEVVEHDGVPSFSDASGRWLPLARSEDPVSAEAFAAIRRGHTVRLVLGRLVHVEETVCLVPRSVVLDVAEGATRASAPGPRLVRIS